MILAAKAGFTAWIMIMMMFMLKLKLEGLVVVSENMCEKCITVAADHISYLVMVSPLLSLSLGSESLKFIHGDHTRN
jgi:hypothetical protein